MKKTFVIFSILISLYIIIKFFFFDIFYIPSNSMLPNYFPGDYVLVSKTKTAKAGDVIVFKKGDEFYIKRVIGLTGQLVKYQNDDVYIDNKKLVREEAQNKKQLPQNIDDREFNLYYESLGLNRYQILIDRNKIDRSHKVLTIPEFSYYVLGDNRNHSTDSRDFGVVGFNRVLGTVVFEI